MPEVIAMHGRILSSMAVGLLLLGGCSASTQGEGDAPTARFDVLTQEQLAATNQRTAYDAIRQLQPRWVTTRRRSTGAVDPVWVYVDGARRGDVEELRMMETSAVIEVRHLDATDAMTMYGTGHSSGVILVTTMP
jgi:hypothetical protein